MKYNTGNTNFIITNLNSFEGLNKSLTVSLNKLKLL